MSIQVLRRWQIIEIAVRVSEFGEVKDQRNCSTFIVGNCAKVSQSDLTPLFTSLVAFQNWTSNKKLGMHRDKLFSTMMSQPTQSLRAKKTHQGRPIVANSKPCNLFLMMGTTTKPQLLHKLIERFHPKQQTLRLFASHNLSTTNNLKEISESTLIARHQ